MAGRTAAQAAASRANLAAARKKRSGATSSKRTPPAHGAHPSLNEQITRINMDVSSRKHAALRAGAPAGKAAAAKDRIAKQTPGTPEHRERRLVRNAMKRTAASEGKSNNASRKSRQIKVMVKAGKARDARKKKR